MAMPQHKYRLNGDALEVAQAIRRHRERAGLTPEQLAELIGINRSTIYHWEAGRLSYTAVRIVKWMLSDILVTDTKDGRSAYYWRERAYIAEATLKQMTELLVGRRDMLQRLEREEAAPDD
jgi:DNA-binding XRE family transcriptional regulator